MDFSALLILFRLTSHFLPGRLMLLLLLILSMANVPPAPVSSWIAQNVFNLWFNQLKICSWVQIISFCPCSWNCVWVDRRLCMRVGWLIFFFLAYSSVAPESTARWLTSCQIQSLPSWLTPCWLCQPNLLLPGWCLTALIYSLVASFPALQSLDFPPLPLQGLTNVSGKQCCAWTL